MEIDQKTILNVYNQCLHWCDIHFTLIKLKCGQIRQTGKIDTTNGLFEFEYVKSLYICDCDTPCNCHSAILWCTFLFLSFSNNSKDIMVIVKHVYIVYMWWAQPIHPYLNGYVDLYDDYHAVNINAECIVISVKVCRYLLPFRVLFEWDPIRKISTAPASFVNTTKQTKQYSNNNQIEIATHTKYYPFITQQLNKQLENLKSCNKIQNVKTMKWVWNSFLFSHS